MKQSNPTVIFLLKILVSVGLMVFLISRIDVNRFLRVISSAHLSYLGVALTGYFLGQIISSIRWAILARPLGFRNPIKEFTLFYLIGMFFNLLAPSTVGGDVGRVFYLARDGNHDQRTKWLGSTAPAVASVIMDRAIGMAVMVWIGALALLVFPQYSLPAFIRYPTFVIALGLICGWMLLSPINKYFRGREHPVVKKLSLVLETYQNHRQVVMQAMIFSLVVHLIQAWIQILLGQALDVQIPWSFSLILYPLVGLFSALPVSFSGFGLREGSYLFLLPTIGISPEKAITVGLIWFIIVAFDSLIGGAVFILRKNSLPSPLASKIEN
ncbi:MAG: lysylphosphatidylglycerol synthase transmembrane domain-containing protein [Candidatus Binatia bacterium]